MSYGVRRAFYKSREWAVCREAYLVRVGRLCEECMRAGRITPAVIVHHKRPLTDDNVSDPDIALGFDNLEAVCLDCHNRIHEPGAKRFKIDDFGRVITRDDCPPCPGTGGRT